MKFKYSELKDLESAITTKCDNQLDALSDIKAQIGAFASSDNISGNNADAIKSYLTTMYNTAISAMQLVMQTYGKEYKRYIKKYASNKMGGSTAVDQEELSETKSGLISTRGAFYTAASNVNKTISFANKNLENHKISGIHYSEVKNARDDAIKIIDETSKTIDEIESESQDGFALIERLIKDLNSVLDARTSHNVNLDTFNPTDFLSDSVIKNLQKDTLSLWVYDYMKTKEDGITVSDNEYREYDLLEDLVKGYGDGDLLVELAMQYDGTPTGEKFWNELVDKYGYPAGRYIGGGADETPYCAAFVSWVAAEMGILEKEIPYYLGVGSGHDWFQERGKYYSKYDDYTPKTGDVIFFGPTGRSHTGYVVKFDPKTNTVYTIEGNTSDESVKAKSYKLSDGWIHGFGSVKYTPREGNSPFKLSKKDMEDIQSISKSVKTSTTSKIDLSTPERKDTHPSIAKTVTKSKSTDTGTSSHKSTETKTTQTADDRSTPPKQAAKKTAEGIAKGSKDVAKQAEKATKEIKKEAEQASKKKTYTVKKGDTLWDIAQEHGVDYHDIAKDNNIENPSLIHPGEEFVINTDN